MGDKEEIRKFIRENYSEIAKKGSAGGCCGEGCTCSCNGAPLNIIDSSIKVGYTEGDISSVPSEANMGLGCGNPIAIAALQEGETVLDLGSGGGFDCFLAREHVGESGHVIGVDMTPDMIELARKNVEKSGYTNVEFRLGEIEHLPVENESVDVIISNCVINLSLDKEQVFKEAFRVLKHGGRLTISDVVATAALPEHVIKDLSMVAGCIAGAEHIDNIKLMLHNTGFKDIKMRPKDNSKEIIQTWVPGKKVENFVASFIIEATK